MDAGDAAEIGGCRKRKSSDGEDDLRPSKIPAVDSDGEDEEATAEIEEAAVAEVMRWLEREISSPSACYQDPAFVTINGNEESCGPSFSDYTSTVMASVDTRGGGGVSSSIGVSSHWSVHEPAGLGIWTVGAVTEEPR